LNRLSRRAKLKGMVKKRTAKAGRNDRRVGREVDPNLWAHRAGKLSTEPKEKTLSPAVSPEISQYMAGLGRKGGALGGKKRLETLTQERRSQIAFKAAQARWSKKAKKP
jgi:hypothetical protein